MGPLSVEWEDGAMDREFGATESCSYVKNIDFPPSDIVFAMLSSLKIQRIKLYQIHYYEEMPVVTAGISIIKTSNHESHYHILVHHHHG